MGQEIELGDICIPALVSVMAAYQLSMFAKAVGDLRHKHKVKPPKVDGPEEFVRGFRAQQNCLEFFGIFMTIFWVASVFFHQVPAGIAGLLYLWSRKSYFHGYIAAADDRVGGFYNSVRMLRLLFLLATLGIVNTFVAQFAGINIKQYAMIWLNLAEPED